MREKVRPLSSCCRIVRETWTAGAPLAVPPLPILPLSHAAFHSACSAADQAGLSRVSGGGQSLLPRAGCEAAAAVGRRGLPRRCAADRAARPASNCAAAFTPRVHPERRHPLHAPQPHTAVAVQQLQAMGKESPAQLPPAAQGSDCAASVHRSLVCLGDLCRWVGCPAGCCGFRVARPVVCGVVGMAPPPAPPSALQTVHLRNPPLPNCAIFPCPTAPQVPGQRAAAGAARLGPVPPLLLDGRARAPGRCGGQGRMGGWWRAAAGGGNTGSQGPSPAMRAVQPAAHRWFVLPATRPQPVVWLCRRQRVQPAGGAGFL